MAFAKNSISCGTPCYTSPLSLNSRCPFQAHDPEEMALPFKEFYSETFLWAPYVSNFHHICELYQACNDSNLFWVPFRTFKTFFSLGSRITKSWLSLVVLVIANLTGQREVPTSSPEEFRKRHCICPVRNLWVVFMSSKKLKPRSTRKLVSGIALAFFQVSFLARY